MDPLSYGPRPSQLVPRLPTGNAAEVCPCLHYALQSPARLC